RMVVIRDAAPPPPGMHAAGRHGAVALELKDLVVDRDGRRALDGVNLKIAAGEIVGIAGVDGNGQGELIETIADVRRPVSGWIRSGAAGAGDWSGGGAGAVVAENRDLDG